MLEDLVAQIPNVLNQVVNALWWIIGLVAFGAVLLWIINILSYNKNVIVREIINNKVVIVEDKGRLVKDKKGVAWWKLKKEKIKDRKFMPCPPPSCIDITRRGKEFVEVYRIDSSYIFAKDEARVAEIPREIFDNMPDDVLENCAPEDRDKKIKTWKDNVLGEWKRKNGVVEAFRPFSTQQRVLTINALIDAEERRGKNLWANLPQLAAIGGVVIIAVCLMIFWSDMAQPVIEAHNIRNAQMTLENEQLQLIKEIKNDIQLVKADQDKLASQVNTAPN